MFILHRSSLATQIGVITNQARHAFGTRQHTHIQNVTYMWYRLSWVAWLKLEWQHSLTYLVSIAAGHMQSDLVCLELYIIDRYSLTMIV